MNCHNKHRLLAAASGDLAHIARRASRARYKYGTPQKTVDQIADAKQLVKAQKEALDDWHAEHGCTYENGGAA